MKNTTRLAFTSALLVGIAIGADACAIPQPRFECQTLSPFWASYTKVSGSGGACADLQGDYVETQRYLVPGSTDARLGILPAFFGRRYRQQRVPTSDPTRPGDFVYRDPSDPNFQKEAAINSFQSLLPDDTGVCAIPTATGEQNYAATSYRISDGGTVAVAARSVAHTWTNFRLVSTAEFPGTLFTARVEVREDGCNATYDVYGIHPLVACATDADCDPNPNPDAGIFVGSGLSSAYRPVCKLFQPLADGGAYPTSLKLVIGNVPGMCVPSVPLDELL